MTGTILDQGMVLVSLFKGVVIGFLIAAPIGPVGLLCIRRAMAEGRMAAVGVGLGAAVGDALFGAVAGFGIHLVSDFLLTWRTPLTAVGGCLMLAMAWLGWRKTALSPEGEAVTGFGMGRDFLATLALTLTNPATVLAFMAVFASFGAADLAGQKVSGGLLILGVFLGSGLWWLTLSTLAEIASRRLASRVPTETWLVRLNHGSAGLLGLVGFGVLGSLLLRGW